MSNTEITSHASVSVIMTCYNQASIIGRAIESILGQSYQNFHLIVLDDCSSDDSVDVVASWQQRYPEKITLYRQPQNLGHAGNMNTG